ncbi:hypothetical protein EBS80_04585, partial [bacterium]|nr:hypothetical protein [bacterium]
MSEEDKIHDVGREGDPEPEAVERDEPSVPKIPERLEEYFNRVETERGERAAAEAALAEAVRMARDQGDRSMHVADTSKETVNGALLRIDGDLSLGKDARA